MSRDEILKRAAGPDESALEFLRGFARRAHWVDDLHDQDCFGVDEPGPERIASEEANWLRVIVVNQFFRQNSAILFPAMISALSAWADSDRMPTDVSRAVLKAQWHEVVWLVAFITGGWPHMREVAGQCREFDVESEPHPAKPCGCGPVEVCHKCAMPTQTATAAEKEPHGTLRT